MPVTRGARRDPGLTLSNAFGVENQLGFVAAQGPCSAFHQSAIKSEYSAWSLGWDPPTRYGTLLAETSDAPCPVSAKPAEPNPLGFRDAGASTLERPL